MLHTSAFFRVSILLLLFGAAVVLGGCNNAPKGQVSEGKKWYRMHNCNSCHGENGNDGRAPDIAGLDMNYRTFVKRLRNNQSMSMPRFSEEKISTSDAADILSYLKSLK
jgi:mono/diheme cytochrome c family protein